MLLTTHFSYHKETKTFVSEISLLAGSIDTIHYFTLYNPKTGNSKIFNLKSIDKDGSGEDIYGWNYETDCGLKALIIND